MSCKQCGECCRWIIFGMAHGGADWNEYYHHHGCKIVPNIGMFVPTICPHMKPVPGTTDRFFCDIYEKRPALCHQTKKGHYVHPGCTNEL